MAAPYPINYPPIINDQGQPPNNFYIPPAPNYYDDRPYTPDSMTDRTSQYTHDSGSESDSYSTDDYPHHQSGDNTLRTLKIRRHLPGSSDPLLQKIPPNVEPADNKFSSSPVHVTIKRHPIEPKQNLIQPVLYPVPVYVQPPVPQNFNNPPIQIIQPVLPIQPTLPIQPVQSIEQIKETAKPPSPKKPTTPIKTSPNPSISSDRYETESFHLPSSRSKKSNITPRKPIRTDMITPRPSNIKPQRIQPGEVIVEKHDNYDEYYQLPNSYTIPKKVISYRKAPGLTTREIENNEIGATRESVYLRSPKNQTVTYRK
ncbi:unnamed protein product [Rotaria sp. Silwood2]|nr:unnamed protein product [Rotaria sp. Silwood2]CAF4345206.1 unnamed protein product [Rotaria sp. Silwood2]